ncbi:methylmalonyl-CoA carboxyltransferase [Marinitoga sp. 1135]|uniref:Acetyl-CoA carboxylase, carboxyltransferase component (Subunits alpha and beta) n=1 Tax=Marinitoga piezophila (strain DSM 14283 / JCM 11233 / KA3) TaxID=443254 RepID=H2J693_MARPK|nr:MULTISPECIES: carboxyl transferase domain-containing protein [Marinitoga]AEX86241.1 acetyl-CoA carboxylase, carboxyltransferase component (subunits alpha and beta) [Marinitoga piezophila KA3]APT76652.1 methylmalonyl-CoA carboxyltransferase [Marinitoga sp. 1137]NUU96425.1 methylmalonyl-CoA carboxyltransferase [Marinitoga sp. 1135]NUU98346.1 methylmalonyl-CoA carboxyltransferase [Marinitoga sp. 1138]
MDEKFQEIYEEFLKRREKLYEGGGKERIEKQHKLGKLTARERIELLVDEGSFVETDLFVKHRSTNFGLDKKSFPYDGVVTGIGTINGKKVAIYSQDFTVQGGSLGEMHAKKIMKLQDMAMKYGMPIIGINDSGGARIQEGVDSLYGYGGIFYRNTLASGVIPQITVIAGPCAGGAVYSPAITDFIIMVENTSQMFITGPQVIKAVTGESVDKEALGGAMTHNAKSGVAHFVASSDQEATEIIKKLLSYIPSNNLETPEETDFDSVELPEKIYDIVSPNPKKGYDVRDIINLVMDEGTFFEVHKYFAPNIVVGFARLGGKSVGIIANQPKVLAGSLDINSSDKAARFIRFCDAFNIPIVTFVDTPGFLPGVSQEHGGIIRHGAKLLYAYSEATVPKLTVILRKAYGGAYIAMASQHIGSDFVYAWPTAEIAVMGSEGAANIIFRKDIQNAENPEQVRKEKIEEYKKEFANPYVAASRGYIEDVIDPKDTRKILIQSLFVAETKAEARPNKKHGNIPL